MFRKIFFATVLLMLFSGAVICEEKDRIAVMDLQDKEKIFDEATRVKITDYIFTKMQSTNAYWMIPKADRDTALEQAIDETAEGSRKECVDEKCQISLTAQLQANFLINPEIKKLYEGTCEISIKKFDVEKRAGVYAWTQNFNCTQQGLFETIGAMDFGGKKSAFQAGRISEQGSALNVQQDDGMIVKITTNPAEAVVLVDGAMLCQKTPCSKFISFGKHEVRIQKEKYLDYVKEHDIKTGVAINADLQPNFGWISIDSDPAGIEVTLDGQDLGKTPIAKMEIEKGAHQVETKNSCHFNQTEKFVIKIGEEKPIKFTMAPREAVLDIKATDETKENDIEADVEIDGRRISDQAGKTPKKYIIPMCSKYVLVKADAGEYGQSIELKEGQTEKISAVLKKSSTPVYTPAPTSNYSYSNYNYSYSSRNKGNWDAHGVMAIPVGATFDKAFIIGLDLGIEFAYGSGRKKDFHRFFSFSLAGKMDFASDFNFDHGLLGIRSFDFKLNLKMNFWYIAGIGGQVEALLGMTGVPNRYLAGITTWAFNLPIYLWTRDRSGFSITLLNVDIGWDYKEPSRGQIAFYTSFEFFLW